MGSRRRSDSPAPWAEPDTQETDDSGESDDSNVDEDSDVEMSPIDSVFDSDESDDNQNAWLIPRNQNYDQWWNGIGASDLSMEDRQLYNMMNRLSRKDKHYLLQAIDFNPNIPVRNMVRSALRCHLYRPLASENKIGDYIVVRQQDDSFQTADAYPERSDDTCAICYDNVKEPIPMSDSDFIEDWVTIYCGHKFHHPCFLSYLQKFEKCPTCGTYKLYNYDLRKPDRPYEVVRYDFIRILDTW